MLSLSHIILEHYSCRSAFHTRSLVSLFDCLLLRRAWLHCGMRPLIVLALSHIFQALSESRSERRVEKRLDIGCGCSFSISHTCGCISIFSSRSICTSKTLDTFLVLLQKSCLNCKIFNLESSNTDSYNSDLGKVVQPHFGMFHHSVLVFRTILPEPSGQ